jgi:hypothetical protein
MVNPVFGSKLQNCIRMKIKEKEGDEFLPRYISLVGLEQELLYKALLRLSMK